MRVSAMRTAAWKRYSRLAWSIGLNQSELWQAEYWLAGHRLAQHPDSLGSGQTQHQGSRRHSSRQERRDGTAG